MTSNAAVSSQAPCVLRWSCNVHWTMRAFAHLVRFWYALSLSSTRSQPNQWTFCAETLLKPSNTWLKWVTVRDAICPCHPWRYCMQQLEYHYTKDKGVLQSAMAQQQ